MSSITAKFLGATDSISFSKTRVDTAAQKGQARVSDQKTDLLVGKPYIVFRSPDDVFMDSLLPNLRGKTLGDSSVRHSRMLLELKGLIEWVDAEDTLKTAATSVLDQAIADKEIFERLRSLMIQA